MCKMVEIVDDLRQTFHPAIIKFGITHDPKWRFWNSKYGYYVDGWPFMQALYVGDSPKEAMMVESMMISIYNDDALTDSGCYNRRPGGESPPTGTTWVYVVLANANFNYIGIEDEREQRLLDSEVILV